MTKQELIDYCFMYWQHVSKKMLDLMKGFPCKYVDNKLGYHSLTCGCDNEFLCALHVNASEDKVFLNLKNSSHESAEVFIENVQYQGVASRIGLNPRFLLNILDNISCKSITLSFNDSASVIELNEKNNYCEMRFIVMLVVI